MSTLGIISMVIVGGIVLGTIGHDCTIVSYPECRFLWVTAVASILGGILLTEALIAHRKAQGKWKIQTQERSNVPNDQAGSPNWQIWIRSITWITLSALLAGLPLIVKGALGVTLFGTLTGLFFVGTVRAILNRLPPLKEENQIN
ncbi:MAG: hypothetical protein AB1801_19055 [Chloroflexota bacterium]